MEPIAEKKKLILESALERIRNYGFHDCPMSKVAQNAGVASGTIYTYFQSKDELIVELFDYVKTLIYERVSQNDNPELDFKTRFYNFWNCLKDLYLEKPAIQRFFEHFVNSPYNTPEIQNKENNWHKWSDNFFQEGKDRGYLRDLNPKIINIMVLGSINSLTRIMVNYKSLLNKEGIDLNHIPEMVWDGIKKQ